MRKWYIICVFISVFHVIHSRAQVSSAVKPESEKVESFEYMSVDDIYTFLELWQTSDDFMMSILISHSEETASVGIISQGKYSISGDTLYLYDDMAGFTMTGKLNENKIIIQKGFRFLHPLVFAFYSRRYESCETIDGWNKYSGVDANKLAPRTDSKPAGVYSYGHNQLSIDKNGKYQYLFREFGPGECKLNCVRQNINFA